MQKYRIFTHLEGLPSPYNACASFVKKQQEQQQKQFGIQENIRLGRKSKKDRGNHSLTLVRTFSKTQQLVP